MCRSRGMHAVRAFRRLRRDRCYCRLSLRHGRPRRILGLLHGSPGPAEVRGRVLAGRHTVSRAEGVCRLGSLRGLRRLRGIARRRMRDGLDRLLGGFEVGPLLSRRQVRGGRGLRSGQVHRQGQHGRLRLSAGAKAESVTPSTRDLTPGPHARTSRQDLALGSRRSWPSVTPGCTAALRRASWCAADRGARRTSAPPEEAAPKRPEGDRLPGAPRPGR